jgi:hypothetical protein
MIDGSKNLETITRGKGNEKWKTVKVVTLRIHVELSLILIVQKITTLILVNAHAVCV